MSQESTPNKLTHETMRKTAEGIEVNRAKDADDLFDKVGIKQGRPWLPGDPPPGSEPVQCLKEKKKSFIGTILLAIKAKFCNSLKL